MGSFGVLLSIGRRENEIRRHILQSLTFLPILQDGELRIPHGGGDEGGRPGGEGNAENSSNTERFSGQTILH